MRTYVVRGELVAISFLLQPCGCRGQAQVTMHGDKCLPNELSLRILMPYCHSKGHTTETKGFLGTYFRDCKLFSTVKHSMVSFNSVGQWFSHLCGRLYSSRRCVIHALEEGGQCWDPFHRHFRGHSPSCILATAHLLLQPRRVPWHTQQGRALMSGSPLKPLHLQTVSIFSCAPPRAEDKAPLWFFHMVIWLPTEMIFQGRC